MAYGLYLGVYHSGVEWALVARPDRLRRGGARPTPAARACSTRINTFIPPSCDKAALRILGLSFAGWNAIASLVLAAVAFRGALSRDDLRMSRREIDQRIRRPSNARLSRTEAERT